MVALFVWQRVKVKFVSCTAPGAFLLCIVPRAQGLC